MMKSHSAKETGIAENKSLLQLLQDEVIVFLWAESGWLRPQFPAHSEMDSDPISGRKLEQRLLPSRKRTQEMAAD